jgi:iron(III) transport system ATP-binding protein
MPALATDHPGAAAPAIDVTAVTKRFGRTAAVDAASLRVGRGELVALLGPSGSGKTTLLRVVAGFEVPDAGRVTVGGRPVAGDGTWVEPDRRRIGMVFQDGALFPHLTVADNLAFGRPAAGRAGECLELVGLAARGSAYPHELSGGERQRVALARALAADPEVVLLDEPFTALDEALRTELREEVAAILRAAGASALLVTHSQQEALSLADVVAVMRDGRIAQVGPPEAVYGAPADRWVAEFLGEADVVAGSAADGVADSELGRFPAASGLGGAVEIVLRPEGVALSPGAAGDGAPARVVRRSYFGHDQLVQVELASGTRLRSRTAGSLCWRPGDAVRVRVVGPVMVLPAPGRSGSGVSGSGVSGSGVAPAERR